MRNLDQYQLGKRTREIVEYYLANPSKTRKEIAKDMGITEGRISQVLLHPKVRAAYRVLAKGHLQDLIPKSVKAMKDCIDQRTNLRVTLEASKSVLTSEKVLNSPEITVKHDITMKSVPELKQILSKGAELAGQDVIDAEIIDEGSDTNA